MLGEEELGDAGGVRLGSSTSTALCCSPTAASQPSREGKRTDNRWRDKPSRRRCFEKREEGKKARKNADKGEGVST